MDLARCIKYHNDILYQKRIAPNFARLLFAHSWIIKIVFNNNDDDNDDEDDDERKNKNKVFDSVLTTAKLNPKKKKN